MVNKSFLSFNIPNTAGINLQRAANHHLMSDQLADPVNQLFDELSPGQVWDGEGFQCAHHLSCAEQSTAHHVLLFLR